MMHQVREHLYCCQAGDHVVLMDLRKDSYFLLQKGLDHAFLANLNGLDISAEDRAKLVSLDLLPEHIEDDQRANPYHVPSPNRSAAEGTDPYRRSSVGAIIEVAFIVISTRFRLRSRNLHEVIAPYRTLATHQVPLHGSKSTASNESCLIDAAKDYTCARRFIPIEASCLLDSLAMHTFLARRQLSTSIVFGVTTEPFSAHAWLQSGDLVLNDALSHACMHTPIMVL